MDVSRNQPRGGKLFAAYVGRTTNLLNRFRWHLGVSGRSTASQVRKGVTLAKGWKNDNPKHRVKASRLIRDHAVIVFLRKGLSGLENAATRDVLELSLCAEQIPPFNIKVER